MRRLPDFIAVGPPRTATSWLHLVLKEKAVLPSKKKETHFFTRSYAKGVDWYLSHFRDCTAQDVVGEVCAAYFESSIARERILEHMPTCRIVCTLRDPVARLYSYYKLMRHNGETTLPFAEAVAYYRKMLDSSRYAFHLENWYTDFGRDNVLVLLNEDLLTSPQAYLDRVTQFIGLPRIEVSEAMLSRNRENAIDSAPRIARLARIARRFRFWLGANRMYRTRHFLRDVGVWRLCFEGGERFSPLDSEIENSLRQKLLPETARLEDLLGRDLHRWKPLRRSRSRDSSATGISRTGTTIKTMEAL